MTSPRPSPTEETDAADGIEPGKRLIRLADDKGLSLAERLANHFYRLTWRTPLHAMRLKGKFPLKLLAVPDDPVPGDARAGKALRLGYFLFRGRKQPIETLDFTKLDLHPDFADYLHGFHWLRDLAAAAPRDQAAPVAEEIMRRWLNAHAEVPSEPAWRVDNAAWRIFFWTAHSPLILSSGDLVYRSLVLNCIARTARHLDRGAEKAPPGLPRVVAWAGIVAASMLMPGGAPRKLFGEAGLKQALESAVYADGGLVSRSPLHQIGAIMALGMLRQVYLVRREDIPGWLTQSLEPVVAALLGVLHGDGMPGSWQGAAPLDPDWLRAVIGLTGVRTRPLKQARDWGYQRVAAGQSVLLVDAAPPPIARLAAAGCASTGAFELSDGVQRIIVNCGGAALAGATIPPDLAQALRTTAAHSTLVLGDSNSTAIMPDGSLGRGVTQVELDRQEIEAGSRIEVNHDGYARRLGYLHRRILLLSQDGRELRGEDILLPAPRRRKASAAVIAIRFHLAPDVEPTLTGDGQGALLRTPAGPVWQFRVGDGRAVIEESLWVDRDGRPQPTLQLVVNGEASAGGASIGWLFKRMG
jgi:uncharacterized heparinase superfamily protein